MNDLNKYQIGLSKIFFRAGQLAYMEKLRSDKLNESAMILQKNARGYLARLRYLRVKKLVLALQSIARRQFAKHKMELIRQEHAATVIQTNWRRYIARKRYLQTRAFVVQIQAACRVWIAKKRHEVLKKEHAATLIQKVARGWMVRKQYRATRDYVIRVQTCIRRRQARKQLIVLRAEAKSVSHLKEASYKLETRVVDLIASLTQQREEKSRLKLQAAELENRIKGWMQTYDKVDQRAKVLEQSFTGGKSTVEEDDTWLQLKEKREALQNEYMASFNKIKGQDKELMRLKEELLHQKDDVAKLRVASKSTKKSNESDINDLKNQISALKAASEHKLFVQ